VIALLAAMVDDGTITTACLLQRVRQNRHLAEPLVVMNGFRYVHDRAPVPKETGWVECGRAKRIAQNLSQKVLERGALLGPGCRLHKYTQAAVPQFVTKNDTAGIRSILPHEFKSLAWLCLDTLSLDKTNGVGDGLLGRRFAVVPGGLKRVRCRGNACRVQMAQAAVRAGEQKLPELAKVHPRT
jgi:hypothetical protein